MGLLWEYHDSSGWWFGTSREGPIFPVARQGLLNLGRYVPHLASLAMDYPKTFSSTDNGCRMDVVCSVRVFDDTHEAHLLRARDGTDFVFSGCLQAGFHSYTILNGVLQQQYPIPMVVSTTGTKILGHHQHSWDSLKSVVDLCAGFGGLGQGAAAAGFTVQVAVDQNKCMLDLYSRAADAHVICGDIGSQQVMQEIWAHSGGARTFTCGFSCQPFSRLGDGKSQADGRSTCLTKALSTAYYLNAQIIVLECVAPAAQDGFVKSELAHFIKHTGFHCSMTELKLDDIWPCRRHRAWWVLSSPEVGPVELTPWPKFHDVHEVFHVIPEIRLWAEDDERQLALDPRELDAFGVNDDQHAKHLLNGKGKAPCALHAWGSQTRACPCGCRSAGFSQSRLESKGLHGCITRSAMFPDGTSLIRHIHPNEAMALNTFDPIIDFGNDVRLTLAAVGQLACPSQALWILSGVLGKIDMMRHARIFTKTEQLQAYRSWLLMRSRQVWPTAHEPIADQTILSLMAFWTQCKDLSLGQLMFPPRWEGLIDGPICIAAVLDHLIRARDAPAPTLLDADLKEMPGESHIVPVFDQPVITVDTDTCGCMVAEFCSVTFMNPVEPPICFQPRCGTTVAQFLDAHCKLIGNFEVEDIRLNDSSIPADHVLAVGQDLQVYLKTATQASKVPVVSPTVAWTQPIEEPIVKSPPRKVSKFDVGECVTPSVLLPDDTAWLDATPLIGLRSEQFLKLSMPGIQNAQQLWSLRHQFLRSEDRISVLEHQERFWADDEIRFHLHAVVQASHEYAIRNGRMSQPVCVLDPLIATAWIQQRGFDCAQWAADHPEIRRDGVPIITVVLIDQHWVPLFISPLNDALQVHTWDGTKASHEGLDVLMNSLAVGLGFTNAMIRREHRLFFTSDLCGALAISFLRYTLVGAFLPSDCTEATVIHAKLKEAYLVELRRCQIARRPWIWGAGDRATTTSPPTSDLHLAVNISRDQRIDLINEKGMAMADDEMRFHLMQLVEHQTHDTVQGSRRFTYMEPLIFNCWESIGHIIAKQWCTKNQQVREQGQNIVTVVSVEDHWLPLWFVPQYTTLKVHTFQSDVSFDHVQRVVEAISEGLGFQTFTIHRIPTGLPEHVMCGAQSLCLVAHVVVNMPLPQTLYELRTIHTNMRASFVAHLYGLEYTPKPVVWGHGKRGESGPLPIMPEDMSPEEQKERRLRMLSGHSYAMGDDEIDFHILHLLDCYRQGPRDVGHVRNFLTVSPKTIHQWMSWDRDEFQEWIENVWQPTQMEGHLVTIVLLQQHWVPLWIAPSGQTAHCHTLTDFMVADDVIDTTFRQIALAMGFAEVVVHKVPHGLVVDRLCGTMSICFLAHIMLRTPLPEDVHQLRSRCWDMKMVFARALDAPPTFPVLWGWGRKGECRPLPKLPAMGPFVAFVSEWLDDLGSSGITLLMDMLLSDCDRDEVTYGMNHVEMKHHVASLNAIAVAGFSFDLILHLPQVYAHAEDFMKSTDICRGFAMLHQEHWSPVLFFRRLDRVVMLCEVECAIETSQLSPNITLSRIEPGGHEFCGALTWMMLAHTCGFPVNMLGGRELQTLLATKFHRSGIVSPPDARKGFAPQGQLIRNLMAELLKHGIPESVVEERAQSAIKALGSEQILAALGNRNPWKQLKMLGNNSKFQFVMPSELAAVVDANKGKQVGGKGKGKGPKTIPQPTELDPSKLQVLEGIFHAQGVPVPQLTMKQIGPVSSGFILMSMHDAEPYLRAGKPVSREPLALLVFHRTGAEVHTALPHASVMVPCRCTINNEPVLTEAILVQVGAGLVEKGTGQALVAVDTPDVVTLKVLVYRDELKGDWSEFCTSPIKCLVSLLPQLKRCFTEGCTCPAWHNAEKLPLRDPILDVWRRQFLRQGFRQCPADKAEFFSVCIRIPRCILEPLLAASGTSGAYCEPRTADGKDILPDFTVIWTPKHTLQETQHLKQTNPAVTGLARLGDRRGLRVHANQAKSVHQQVRPDSVFLPSGPKLSFTVGPLPYGVDRQAVVKILQQGGWECRPLQPTTPVPGRGVMWLVQATEDPENAIISTTMGEIVITKQKTETAITTKSSSNVGSAATLALCGADAQGNKASEDPWAHTDPWRSYQPVAGPIATGPTEGMQQIETRIQNAVLAKIQTPMEQDDLPDRVHQLEGQVHQLLTKQQGLETQFHDFSGQHTQQINALQGQVTAQAQQLHGHLENQNQTMQALFEQQMNQIRGLLAKRPREEGLE